VPDPKVKQLTLNSQGWRSQTLGSVSQSLSVASARLRKESERECKYWEQVAKLRENGTAISRYPRDTSAVAVHYGSANAAPQFQPRGFALLRQDTDSSMYIDRGAVPHHRKRIRVEIYRGSQSSGSYKFDAGSICDTSEVTQAIATARDELLEEELFHEIGREARISANQGITARGQTIIANIENEYEILISLKVPLLDPENSNPEDNFLAEYIGLSLRALLQQAHKETYICRSQTPPPLLARTTSPTEHAILRPLISKLKHRVAVEELQSSVDKKILEPVRRAGLDIDWQHGTTQDSEVRPDDAQKEFIVSNQPRRSVFNFVLPTHRQVYVTITSHLGSPIYGNKYDVSGLDDEFAPVKPASYKTLDTTLGALLELSRQDLVIFVASLEVPNHSDKHEDKTKGLRWKVTRPHHGELTLSSTRSLRLVAKMRVEMVNSNLVIRLAPAAPEYQKGKKVLAWTWGRRGMSNGAMVTGNPEDVNIDKAVAENLTLGEVVEKSLSLATSHT
jgi:Subunit 17 of Mediator complex